MNQLFLTPRQSALLIGVGLTSLSRLSRLNGFPPKIYIGRRNYKYSKEELLKWMNNGGIFQGDVK